MSEFLNSKTGETIKREDPTGEEFIYSGKTLILEIDMQGEVTYANKRFVETSGYSKSELIGSPHCMHMHPQMPKGIFKDACEKTSAGKTWQGYFQNITKDGVAYWTEVSIQPKLSDSNEILGFMAVRREVDEEELKRVIIDYKKLKESGDSELKSEYCGELYMGRGSCSF